MKYLDKVGLKDCINRYPQTLSGGQKQRLLIALAMCSDAPVLILDEPTSGLDGKNMIRVANLLRKLANEGRCILVITHDVELISLVADTICYVGKGEVLYHKNIRS